jgi:sugar O-acyltransferase (sialic acid O-acetyltransferase NeuD family)
MGKIVIFGNGDIGELAELYFRTDSKHEVVAFVADDEYVKSDTFCSLPLIKLSTLLEKYTPNKFKMFVALSYSNMNKDRAKKYEQIKNMGYTLVSYISSHCTNLTEKKIGDNCFILEDNTIQPFVKIGNNVIIWSGNHIGHESVIEDNCYITSHVIISGHVHIHSFCFIGVNATLHDNIIIAPETLIGAGAVIAKDTIEKGVYLPPKSTLINKKSDEIKI